MRPHDRHAREAGGARRRPLAVVGRLPLEVRPDRHRDPARPRRARSRAAWKTASSCCTSTSAARSPTSATSRARSTRRPASTSNSPSSAPAWNTWTSAAAWASTTTARRPTSNRAPTTRCRNTPTTSSITSRACATKPACRIRRSSPRAAARWWPITACWCSTCWACPASATSDVPDDCRPTTWSSRSST